MDADKHVHADMEEDPTVRQPKVERPKRTTQEWMDDMNDVNE